jgi:uncharacterized repeat protein (TIGR02543 family)
MPLKRARSRAAERGDDGAELIEFALVAVVFFALLVGGLFVLIGVIAKGQASSDISTAASFAAEGGCSVGTGPIPNPTCTDGSTPPSTCAAADGNTLSGAGGEATIATICEIEQMIGGTFFDTVPASLQVAIYCPGPGPMPYSENISGLSCGDSQSVWICARAWDSNVYPGVVGPSWISSESEQIVATTAAATTTTGGTTTTTTAPASNLQFETYYPINPSGEPWTNTANMNCGPVYAVTYEDINSDGNSPTSGNPPTDSQSPYPLGATATILGNTGNPPLTLTGHTFEGWCTTDTATDPTVCNGGNSYTPGETIAVSDNVTLYAQWS